MTQALELTLLILLILMSLVLLVIGIRNIVEDIISHQENKKFEKKMDDTIRELIAIAEKQAEEQTNEIATEKDTDKVDYSKMNVQQLKNEAKARNIKGYYNLHKDELIKVLSK